jgi:hypothetical protein
MENKKVHFARAHKSGIAIARDGRREGARGTHTGNGIVASGNTG